MDQYVHVENSPSLTLKNDVAYSIQDMWNGEGGRRPRAHAGLGIPKHGPRNVIESSSGNNWAYLYLSSVKMNQIVRKFRRSV